MREKPFAVFLKSSVVEIDMKYLIQLAACMALTGGCTSSPVNQLAANSSAVSALPLEAQNSKLQAVATADIGVPVLYIDPDSGNSVELVVRSEYFSANGRNCRRFSEVSGGERRNSVSCQDHRKGWIELPLASYLR